MPGSLVFGSFVENHLTYNYKKPERKISQGFEVTEF